MRSVVDRNVVRRVIAVHTQYILEEKSTCILKVQLCLLKGIWPGGGRVPLILNISTRRK